MNFVFAVKMKIAAFNVKTFGEKKVNDEFVRRNLIKVSQCVLCVDSTSCWSNRVRHEIRGRVTFLKTLIMG